MLISPGSGLDNRDCATPGRSCSPRPHAPRAGAGAAAAAVVLSGSSGPPSISSAIQVHTARQRHRALVGDAVVDLRALAAAPRITRGASAQVLRQVGLGGVDLLQQLGDVALVVAQRREQLEADRRGQQRENSSAADSKTRRPRPSGRRGAVASLMRESSGSETVRLAPEAVVVAVEHRGDRRRLLGEEAQVQLGAAVLDHAAQRAGLLMRPCGR